MNIILKYPNGTIILQFNYTDYVFNDDILEGNRLGNYQVEVKDMTIVTNS